MFVTAHLVAGLLIGKLTNSYFLAIAASLFVDLDHLIVYLRHGILFKPKKLWKTITDPADPYGDQRNYFHSFITWAIVSAVLMLVNFPIGLVISLGYGSHLLLDLLDGSDFYPFYPIKYKVLGPIPYLGTLEIVLTAALAVLFFVL